MGNCNCWLKMSIAKPPTGNPVSGSRGPAWFNPNPRSVVPPPAKNRSGRGMSSATVSPSGCSMPRRVDRAKVNCRPRGVVGRVLKRRPEKAGAGADGRERPNPHHGIEIAARRIGGIVAAVAHPGHREEGNVRRLAEQRNLLRLHLQVAGLHLPVDVAEHEVRSRERACRSAARSLLLASR